MVFSKVFSVDLLVILFFFVHLQKFFKQQDYGINKRCICKKAA